MVAAVRCYRCCNAERLQISHGGQNTIVLRGGGHGQCLHRDGASGGCGGQGAEVAVKLLHEGVRGARDVAPGCSCPGGGCDVVDKGGGVCGTEGVAAACRQSRLPFESFVEEEELILPCLQGLVLGDFAVLFGAVLGEGFCLEERGGYNGGEKVV